MRTNRTSLRRNRIALQQQSTQTFILQNPPPHKLDVWLPRLANFTQMALLVLTACGFYFTVLPLYQKALLDEAFARREIELKQVTAALETKYELLRNLAVRDFIMFTGPDCTGLTEKVGEGQSYTSVHSKVLTMDVKKCVLDHEAEARSLLQLRQEDRTFFRTALLEVADRIVRLQSAAAASYARVDSDINDTNVEVYARKGEFSNKALSLLTPYMKPDDVTASKRKQAVAELRSERFQAYRNAALDQLFSLNKMKWPTRKQ